MKVTVNHLRFCTLFLLLMAMVIGSSAPVAAQGPPVEPPTNPTPTPPQPAPRCNAPGRVYNHTTIPGGANIKIWYDDNNGNQQTATVAPGSNSRSFTCDVDHFAVLGVPWRYCVGPFCSNKNAGQKTRIIGRPIGWTVKCYNDPGNSRPVRCNGQAGKH